MGENEQAVEMIRGPESRFLWRRGTRPARTQEMEERETRDEGEDVLSHFFSGYIRQLRIGNDCMASYALCTHLRNKE